MRNQDAKTRTVVLCGGGSSAHVLIAMGRTPEEAHCSVRFSLSRATTAEDIQTSVRALARVLEEAESTVRFLPCK